MADLPGDVLEKILGFLALSDVENAHVNLFAFGSTCTSWRAAVHADAPVWHDALLHRFGVVVGHRESRELHPFQDHSYAYSVRDLCFGDYLNDDGFLKDLEHGFYMQYMSDGGRGLYLVYRKIFGDLPLRDFRRMTRSWQRIMTARRGGSWHHVAESNKYDTGSPLCEELWKEDNEWYRRYVHETTRAALRSEPSPFGRNDTFDAVADHETINAEDGYNRSLRSVGEPTVKASCDEFVDDMCADGTPGDKRPMERGMHPSLQLMFRLRDGQKVVAGDQDDEQVQKDEDDGHYLDHKVINMWEGGKFGKTRLRHRFAQALLGNGLLGGYTVYDNHVNVRLLSLDSSRKLTKFLSAEGIMSAEKGRNVLLAASFDMQKLVWANAKTGTVWVHVTEQSGQRSGTRAHPAGMDVVDWFEEFSRRVGFGVYVVDSQMDSAIPQGSGGWRPTALSQFPALARAGTSVCGDGQGSAVASDAAQRQEVTAYEEVTKNAVRISVSTVYMENGNMWTYRVRMYMLSIKEQETRWRLRNPSDDSRLTHPFRPMHKAQLTKRLWLITDENGHEQRVEGEAVIGQYPLLEPGKPAFSYQSQTNLPGGGPGTMKGGFYFVEGSMNDETGPEFFAKCPEFVLCKPRFMF